MANLWLSHLRGVCLQGTHSRSTLHHVNRGSRIICRTAHSLNPSYNPRFKQLSIQVTNNGDKPDPELWPILNLLKPQSNEWRGRWTKDNHCHPGLVILLTPSLLPWLKDETFIPKILKKISYNPTAESTLQYDVICACVDGIAPEEHYGTFHEQPATEGLSFLHAPSYRVFPAYTTLPIFPRVEEGEAVPPPTTPGAITFVRGHAHSDRVIIPLANTIFQNGKSSFLEHTKWNFKDGSFILDKKWDDKRQAAIFAFAAIKKRLLSFIPARPVTPFRSIESGMGNIVRELRFDDDNVGPASRELEAAVSKISESLGGSMVEIWALIVPDKVFKAGTDNAPEHQGPEYVGYWLDHGATICRVVSGGGGWGPKQGLLSLDPQIDYDVETKASSASATEQNVTSLGTLAQPGAFIQFLAIDHDLPPPLVAKKHPPINPRKSIVFGTIPSTIDEIPRVTSEGQKPKYTYRQGHFGCVSGSGIFYHRGQPKSKKDKKADVASESLEEPDSNQEKPSTSIYSKIDLPYSYIYMDSRIIQQRERKPVKRLSPLIKKIPVLSPKEENPRLRARILHSTLHGTTILHPQEKEEFQKHKPKD